MALMQSHVFDRFRQPEGGRERDDERHDAADQEDDLPAVLWHQHGRHEARNGSAERHRTDGDDGECRTQPARRRFRVDGDHIWNDATDAKPSQQPQPEHLVEIGGVGSGQRE